MHGIVFEILEAFILENYDEDSWNSIKKKARCTTGKNGFVTRAIYEYKMFVKLIRSASSCLDKPSKQILRELGNSSIGYLFKSEYGDILRCQASNLRDWLSFVNVMLDHFQKSFPEDDDNQAMEFWCEDFKRDEEFFLFHFYCQRGNIFAPLVVGMIESLAASYFKVEIKMDLLALQDNISADYTTWKIGPAEPKYSIRVNQTPTADSSSAAPPTSSLIADKEGISIPNLRQVFPFHVIISQEFSILQIGQKLAMALGVEEDDLIGIHIQDAFKITKPAMAFSWEWKAIERISDQPIFLKPVIQPNDPSEQVSTVSFKTSIFYFSEELVMLSMFPSGKSMRPLKRAGLSLADLASITSEEDAIILSECMAQEAGKTHALDKLSKDLKSEQNLSNTLLYNMLPKNVADDLRRGKTVEPRYHENVTLFFSDIEGFTTLCDQVQPWDVIDLMNQLYSVMDYLADRFEIYKVETVGDAYVCAAGLPEPDEDHAQKIANFALAVVECVRHIKSPVTGDPIKLRIGIHTGSCTAGVVGTLTPHYCLFGDMVNFTARHETTGLPEKIHCSHDLCDLLKSLSPAGCQQYRFKARGLVDMKGKGEHHTYWLESGTENNSVANPTSLMILSNKVRKKLSSKKWKMRRYFQRHGGLVDDSVSVNSSNAFSSANSAMSSMRSITSLGSGDDSSGSRRIEDELHKLSSDGNIVSFSEELLPEQAQLWRELHFDTSISDEDIETEVFELLFNALKKSMDKGGKRIAVLEDQLRSFVDDIAAMYGEETIYHNLRNAANIMLRANFLLERQKNLSQQDTWDSFVLLFSIFIRDMNHSDVTNEQLEVEHHPLVSQYHAKGGYQQRSSLDYAFDILEDEYRELYDEIFLGCPFFRRSVKKLVVLSADLEIKRKFQARIAKYGRFRMYRRDSMRMSKEVNEAGSWLILAFATVGHYCQSQDIFLQWNRLHFQAQLSAFQHGRSDDPRPRWHAEQAAYFADIIHPLVDYVESLLEDSPCLMYGANKNTQIWNTNVRELLAASMVSVAKVELAPWAGQSDLIAADLKILEEMLVEVASMNSGMLLSSSSPETSIPSEELQLVIPLTNNNQTKVELGMTVRQELREFVVEIAGAYDDHDFHNFHHASQVLHVTDLFLRSMGEATADLYGVTFDPLSRFAILFSALIQDAKHPGVSNRHLARENPDLARKYRLRSISEQHAIDTGWGILMSETYGNLRGCLFGASGADSKKFRQIVVSCVMATDMYDEKLRSMRQERWEETSTDSNILATAVMDHIMQVSSIAHTMQDWEIYQEWNELLFFESFCAFVEDRIATDPSKSWYTEQLQYFDDIVIPLARNAKSSGILSIIGEQLLDQALKNRHHWERDGEAMVDAMLRKMKGRQGKGSFTNTSSAAESGLTSAIVDQIESLSKVIKRYERKVETACGNLITVAYKDHPGAATSDLRQKPWSTIREHFRSQEWYQLSYSGNMDDDESSGFNDTSGRHLGRYDSTQNLLQKQHVGDDVTADATDSSESNITPQDRQDPVWA